MSYHEWVSFSGFRLIFLGTRTPDWKVLLQTGSNRTWMNMTWLTSCMEATFETYRLWTIWSGSVGLILGLPNPHGGTIKETPASAFFESYLWAYFLNNPFQGFLPSVFNSPRSSPVTLFVSHSPLNVFQQYLRRVGTGACTFTVRCSPLPNPSCPCQLRVLLPHVV